MSRSVPRWWPDQTHGRLESPGPPPEGVGDVAAVQAFEINFEAMRSEARVIDDVKIAEAAKDRGRAYAWCDGHGYSHSHGTVF